MIRPVDQAALALARMLFRDYLRIVEAEARPKTLPAVRNALSRDREHVMRRFEAEELDAYFVARTSVVNGQPTGDKALEFAAAIRNGSPLYIAGIADGLLEQIGAAP